MKRLKRLPFKSIFWLETRVFSSHSVTMESFFLAMVSIFFFIQINSVDLLPSSSSSSLVNNQSGQLVDLQRKTFDVSQLIRPLRGLGGEGNESSNNNNDSHSSSSTGSATSLENPIFKNLFTIVVYFLIIFVSLCGNVLVLRVIASRKKLQTTTNLFIASLAVSDCLTTTLNIPFNVARFLSLNYPFSALFCKLVPFIQVCCVYVSTLTMGVIAIHRYITLSCPHRTLYSSSGSKMSNQMSSMRGGCRLGTILVFVWLLAGLLAIPHSMFNQIVPVLYRNVTYTRCRAEYPKFEFNFPFWLSVEAFLTQYLIPLSITCTLYIKIGFIVSKQGRLATKGNNRRKKEQDDARRRRIIMLALVVAVFALCWFPLNLYHLLVDFHLTKPNFNVFLICHWIAMSSVCYNPFIYCWLNESFRKGAYKMFTLICYCCCPKLMAAEMGSSNNHHNQDNHFSHSERLASTYQCDDNRDQIREHENNQQQQQKKSQIFSKLTNLPSLTTTMTTNLEISQYNNDGDNPNHGDQSKVSLKKFDETLEAQSVPKAIHLVDQNPILIDGRELSKTSHNCQTNGLTKDESKQQTTSSSNNNTVEECEEKNPAENVLPLSNQAQNSGPKAVHSLPPPPSSSSSSKFSIITAATNSGDCHLFNTNEQHTTKTTTYV